MKMIKRICAVLLSVILLLSIASGINCYGFSINEEEKIYSNATLSDDFAEDKVIVIIKESESEINKVHSFDEFDNVEIERVDDLTLIEGSVEEKECLIRNNFHQILKITLKSKGKQNVLEAVNKLQKNNSFLYVGPAYRVYLPSSCNEEQTEMSQRSTVPNDSFYSSQWGLPNINASSAWGITKGSNNVLVGVIDSGINSSHEDLINKVDLSLGGNFTGDGQGTTDLIGHGTHVAGIIGSNTNNSTGVSGVSWYVRLVSLKVFSTVNGHEGDTSCVVSAINYAINNNIKILNYSGWATATPELSTIINQYSGLLICAAGNDQANTDSNPHYPSSYPSSNIISVAAIDSDNSLASYSNYGASSVDLAAPGTSILSTYPIALCNSQGSTNGHYATGYHYMSGTSMATPHVAGVAALIKSLNSNFNSAFIKRAIMAHTTSVPSLSGKCVTGGKLNAYAAVNYANNNKYICSNSDTIQAVPGGVRVSGWAYAHSHPSSSLRIHVYIGGSASSGTGELHDIGTTNHLRNDINDIFGITGNHGFSKRVATNLRGTQEVNVYAINTVTGTSKKIGSATVNIPVGDPTGNVDHINALPGKIDVAGWVFDCDNPDYSVEVHVYVGGPSGTPGVESFAITADQPRPDINGHYDILGDHGFSEIRTTNKRGTQEVYIYAINIGNGSNKLLGHQTVTIPTGNPIGHIDHINMSSGQVYVSGWAFDYDTPFSPIAIHVYIGGSAGTTGAEGHALSTNTLRTDINNNYHLEGNHGFSHSITTSKTGTQEVYIYAINAGAGPNICLGHQSVTI
ncbi:MAG: S8 family serine peptidase [Clostridia bacterium]|nr:S8 family serine peptidase [Clostridia bacterium]